MTKKSLQLLLVDRNDHKRPLYDKELELLDLAFKRAISRAVEGGTKLHFESTVKGSGRFLVRCSDSGTYGWVKKAIRTFRPWEDADLTALHPTEVEGMVVFKTWLTTPKGWDSRKIINLFQGQNDHLPLYTNRWDIESCLWKGNGWLLRVGIDEMSLEALKRVNYRPYFLDYRPTFEKVGKQSLN